ncbi:hypothetical protein [Cetobacterium sp.]|uniref:hypothetical protein n=1 Tax=Cetobacterium sp. TaxID=2071632 RepID=UPI0025BD7A63|nr:hypothetical protein [Cetobacterium sp.]
MRQSSITETKNEILSLYKKKIVIENAIKRKKRRQEEFLNSFKNRIELKFVKILKKIIKLNECSLALNDEENLKNLIAQVEKIDEKIKAKENLKKELEKKKETMECLFDKVIYSENLAKDKDIFNKKVEKKVDKKINLKITEHGLLRYLERVKRVDLDSIKSEILEIFYKDEFRKNGEFEKNGVRYIIQGNKIITVINKLPQKKKEISKYMLYYSRYRKSRCKVSR